MTKKELSKFNTNQRRAIAAAKKSVAQQMSAFKKAGKVLDKKLKWAIEDAIKKEADRVKQEKYEEDKEFSVECFYNMFVHGLQGIIEKYGADHFTERHISKYGRKVATSLYDYKSTRTGYMSIGLQYALDAGAKLSDVGTEEHFWPRQYVGELFVRYILEHNDISLAELRELLDKHTHVHLVLKDENQHLKDFQQSKKFNSWAESYYQASIILFHAVSGNLHPELVKLYLK